MSWKVNTMGEPCARCSHDAGDHAMFRGRCEHLRVNGRARTAQQCACIAFKRTKRALRELAKLESGSGEVRS